MKKEGEELMELKHEPVPGYRTIFYIAFLVGLMYLSVIIFLAR